MYKIYNPLPQKHFTHAIFDADQTLYPLSTGFEKENVIRRIYQVVHHALLKKNGPNQRFEESIKMAEGFYHSCGDSIFGCCQALGLDARTMYNVAFTEEIDYSTLPTCEHTRNQLLMLRNRYRVRLAVLSNGTDLHVHQIIEALGLDGVFGFIHGVNNSGFRPKPEAAAFEATLWELSTQAQHAILVEDSLRNLAGARRLGFGYNIYIGETEKTAPENKEGTYDLWAQTLLEALQVLNQIFEAMPPMLPPNLRT